MIHAANRLAPRMVLIITNHEYRRKLGISMQEEEEFVVIVTPREKKAAVMNAISDACGLRTDAHGIILSLPVDEVIGLETGENTL